MKSAYLMIISTCTTEVTTMFASTCLSWAVPVAAQDCHQLGTLASVWYPFLGLRQQTSKNEPMSPIVSINNQIIRSKKKWYLSCSCKWSSCWGKAENPLPLYYYFVSHPPGGASADCRTSHYLREAGQTGETLCCSHQALGPFTGQSQQ